MIVTNPLLLFFACVMVIAHDAIFLWFMYSALKWSYDHYFIALFITVAMQAGVIFSVSRFGTTTSC